MTKTGSFAKIKGTTIDGIAVMTLASDKVNALDVETLDEIAAYVGGCSADPEVRALVVTGEGSIFSAGLNVSEVLDNEPNRTGVLLEALNTALVRLFRFAKPTVAAINGPAIAGGCILACACDKRVMAEGARIGATELRVGVSFPVFAIELLRHACGERAEQLIFDANLLDADEARHLGLAHQSPPPGRTAIRRHRARPAAGGARRPGLRTGQGDDETIGTHGPRGRRMPPSRGRGTRALAGRPDPGQPRTAPQAEALTPGGGAGPPLQPLSARCGRTSAGRRRTVQAAPSRRSGRLGAWRPSG